MVLLSYPLSSVTFYPDNKRGDNVSWVFIKYQLYQVPFKHSW